MLRLFLLGLLLLGLATGFRYQWLELNWSRFIDDVGLPVPEPGDGFDLNRWLIGEPESDDHHQ